MLALTEIKEDRAWEATMSRRYRWPIQGLTLAFPLGFIGAIQQVPEPDEGE